MSQKQTLDPPITPEERRDARLLARALEGRTAKEAPGDTLEAVRLLEALGKGIGRDELTRLRLRRELVAAASGRRRGSWIGLAVAASVLLAALLLWLPGRSRRPTEALLAEREAAARAAVATLTLSPSLSGSLNPALAGSLKESRNARLLAPLSRTRFDTLARGATADPASSATTAGSPTPGGSS